MENPIETGTRSSRTRIGLWAGLIVLGDQLLHGLDLGLNAALFVTIVTAALLGARVRSRVDAPTRRLALANFGLALALILDPGPLPVGLAVIGLTTLGLWVRAGSDRELTVWGGRVAQSLCTGWTRLFQDLPLLGRQTRDVPLRDIGKGAGEWVVPVSFSMVFVVLFAVANPIVSDFFVRAFTSLDEHLLNFGQFVTVERILFWVVLGAFLWSWLRFRGAGWLAGTVDDHLSFRDDVARPATVVRCLTLFNAVFAVQTLLDLLVLGTGGGLPAGMTYAEYAHRGAYPLIATSLLAGLFVLVTFSAGQKAAEDRRARHLVYAWIGQNLILLISTVYRLAMYVEVYGLSRWRLATFLWTGLVALGFAFIAARVLASRTNGWLIRRNALALAGVLYVSCFVDYDGMIARHNVRSSVVMGGAGPEVDVEYLASLGLAAQPALTELLHELGRRPEEDLRLRFRTERAIQILDDRAVRLSGDWRTFSVRAWRS